MEGCFTVRNHGFEKGGVISMQYCDKCRVHLRGSQKVCPLCGGIISEDDDRTEEVFPIIPTIYQEFNIFIRLMILISISTVIISFAVNFIFTRESRWSLFVAAAILCMWISLFFIIRKKNNIPKTIIWQVVIVGILSVLWDWFVGWHGWSIDFVIPSICVGAMIVMAVSAKLLKTGIQDLIIYMLVDGIFGILPIVFILFGNLHVLIPSVICVAASAISLSALIIFQGDNMKAELKRRMHI